MVKEPLRFENGCMLIPEAPGIGVELADDAEELYPANERAVSYTHLVEATKEKSKTQRTLNDVAIS